MKDNLFTLFFILALLLSLMLNGCRALYEMEDDELFYLKHKGAEMPIRVSGDRSSGVFILHLHGGPGGNTQEYHRYEMINFLEEKYANVYWDQRGAGYSAGNTGQEMFTLEQFTEDTDKVVDLINLKYSNPQIVLMGISWGGGLGTAYLLEPSRQAKITAWIEIDGSHNNVWRLELSRQFVIDYVTEMISSGNDPEGEWQAILDWYSRNPEITIDTINQHAGYVYAAKGYLPDGEENPAFSNTIQNILLFSPYHFFVDYFNVIYTQDNFDIWNLDMTNEMKNIIIPSLVIWGEHDGILPVPLAQEAYNSLGTPATDKYLTILPNSAHTPVVRDMPLFRETVIGFIDSYTE